MSKEQIINAIVAKLQGIYNVLQAIGQWIDDQLTNNTNTPRNP